MNGISSKALSFGNPPNKIKYNNMELQAGEFSDGMGLEVYEYKYRFYDHQIGRFISQDKLADQYPYYAPYQFAGNQVPNAIDLDGLEPYLPNYQLEIELARKSKGGEQAYLDRKLKEGIGTVKAAKVAAIATVAIVQPEIGIPLMVSEISGVPVTPSPAALEATAGSELSTAMNSVDEIAPTISLADKARVFEAGGEIGMMKGAANLAVDAKTGFFNIEVTAGSETGIITGEISINKGTIGFTNLEMVNSKGGLGATELQNSIGFPTINQLKNELSELVKAGGYNSGYIEFSRLRTGGSTKSTAPLRYELLETPK